MNSNQWVSQLTGAFVSYFMTISGALPKHAFPSLEFVPISDSQIANLAPEFFVMDGTPLWFVHDGETGTSHDFVCGAQNHFNEHGTLSGTMLLQLMQACVEADCGFRIWYASDKPESHRELAEFATLGELYSGIVRLLMDDRDICVRWKRNGHR